LKRIVIIYHSSILPDAGPDELDVLDEAEHVANGLTALGFQPLILPFPDDINELLGALKDHKPEFIFNLVETLHGDGRMIHIAPYWFEHLAIPYSGCPAQAIYTTSNKIVAKQLMFATGIKTPALLEFKDLDRLSGLDGKRYLVKSVWEHASVGLDESKKLVFDDVNGLRDEFLYRQKAGGLYFAEEYIEGREFNITLLGGKDGVEVMPAAEIRFIDFPKDTPKIVGYRAKWVEDSFEYTHTVRSFEFTDDDKPLLERLKGLCEKCWEVFGLRGYARVDFRVDKDGNIYVLEINANPCISPDSGFIAATMRNGISFGDVLKRIIEDLKN